MGNPFRYAMCNEAFEAPHSGGRYVQADLSAFAAACRVLRSAGYEGIEIAPFTLAPDPLEIDAAKRAE